MASEAMSAEMMNLESSNAGAGALDHARFTPNAAGDGRTPYTSVDHFPKATELYHTDNPRVDTATMFDSFQEAIDWRSRLSRNDRKLDQTIPHMEDQKKAFVKVLFVAFKSIANATDNEHMIDPFREHRHDNSRVEVLCWSILEACIRRAQAGPLLYAFDPVKAKYNSNLPDFASRFDAIVVAMSTSKTICKHLYDAPYMNQFVDDPINSRKRVHANRELNKRKGKAMQEGKKAIQAKSKDQILGRGATGTTSEGHNRLASGATLYAGSNDTTPTKAQSTITDSIATDFGSMVNPYLTPNLVPTSSYSAPGLYPTHTASALRPSASTFTPMNRATFSGTSYNDDITDIYDMSTMMAGTSQTPIPYPSSQITSFPILSQSFNFGNDFHANGGRFGGTPAHVSQIESTTPKGTPTRVMPTRSATSSSQYTPQRSDNSSETCDNVREADESDDEDPTWDPSAERSKKQRR